MERFICCVIFGKTLAPNMDLWKCDLTQCEVGVEEQDWFLFT